MPCTGTQWLMRHERLRSTSASSGPVSFSRLRVTSSGGVILVIAAPARFPHSMTLLTPPSNAVPYPSRLARRWFRRGRGGAWANLRAWTRVYPYLVWASSRRHREIKIYSRLLRPLTNMCQRIATSKRCHRHRVEYTRYFSSEINVRERSCCFFWRIIIL